MLLFLVENLCFYNKYDVFIKMWWAFNVQFFFWNHFKKETRDNEKENNSGENGAAGHSVEQKKLDG